MVYVFGFIGFVLGFIFGQFFLFFLLRNTSKEDLLNDRYLKLKYGTINWSLAFAGTYFMLLMYDRYFH